MDDKIYKLNVSPTLYSNPKFNVNVISIKLEDNPASITINLKIAGHEFFSKITYKTIPSWDELWKKCGGLRFASSILGAIVAWDSMRFLSLGGEEVFLCEGLELDELTKKFWRHCFLNQFGEWRFLNTFLYRKNNLPQIICSNNLNDSDSDVSAKDTIQSSFLNENERWLLANGGGKDTLVGMLLFNDAKVNYDVYEGYLPIGGSWELQASLLANLRNAITPTDVNFVSVTVEDNFFSLDEETINKMGITAKFFKTDFAVGHTANYPGYFPLILYHNYSHVWFNIEASSDRIMAIWNEEHINHQWCKSEEYQKGSTELFLRITNNHFFKGFSSTLRGLNDIHIYAIANTDSELLKKTHSCNYGKPWCRKCPKCCFSYLMMCSIKDESFALEVVGGQQSLFEMPQNIEHWHNLLDHTKVAWECVPSHEECLIAVNECLQKGIYYPILENFAKQAEMLLPEIQQQYKTVNWDKIPRELRYVTLARIGKANKEIPLDLVIVGGGQSGLSMSYLLKQKNINHVVLESKQEGASWENRWDSFQLNTPNRDFNLPGKAYSGPNPHGFATKSQVIERLKNYSQQFNLPVICKTPVISVEKCGTEFIVETAIARIRTKSVIAATGEYINPRLPKFEGNIPLQINWLHSRNYRNPDQLKSGAILVVGGGQSGAQIVEDLLARDRKVYWSLSNRPSNIRRLRGKDFMEWWDIGGILHRNVEDHPEVISDNYDALRKIRSMEFPLVSGTGRDGLGHSISLQKLTESGVIIVGKLSKFENSIVFFSEKIAEQIHQAIKGSKREYKMLMGFADTYYKTNHEYLFNDKTFLPPEIFTKWSLNTKITSIDLNEANISTIVFATGYSNDWPWLKISNGFDIMGYPIGKYGISPIPGLYFLGLFNLQRLSSTCLCNGGRDASTLLPHILEHLAIKYNNYNIDSSRKKILAILPTLEDREYLLRYAALTGHYIHFIEDKITSVDKESVFNVVSYTKNCIMQALQLRIDGVFYSHSLASLIAAVVCEYSGIQGNSIDATFMAINTEFSLQKDQNNIWRHFVRLGTEYILPDFVPFPVRIKSSCGNLELCQTPIGNLNDLQKFLIQLGKEDDNLDNIYRDFFAYYIDAVKYPGCIQRTLTIEECAIDNITPYYVEGWSDDVGNPTLWGIEAELATENLQHLLTKRLKNELEKTAFSIVQKLKFKRTFWHIKFWFKEGQLYVKDIKNYANISLASLYLKKYNSDLYQAILLVSIGDFSSIKLICQQNQNGFMNKHISELINKEN